MFTAESPLYVVIRFVTLTGVTLLIGVLVFRAGVLRFTRRSGALGPGVAGDAHLRASRLGTLGALALLIAAPLRLAAQYATLGVEGSIDREMLAVVVTSTTWGHGWLLQLLAVTFAYWGVSRRPPGPSPVQAIAAALPLAIFPGMSGHPAAAPNVVLEVAVDAVHVVGAGAWMGGLAVLALAGVPAVLRMGGVERGPATLALVRAFSPVALSASATLAITGLYASWQRVGSLAALRDTPYGHSLLLKVALVGVLVMLGALNWRRLGPACGSEAGAVALRRAMAWEMVVGVAILIVTAVLIARPAPMESIS